MNHYEIMDTIVSFTHDMYEFSNGRCGEFALACSIIFDTFGINNEWCTLFDDDEPIHAYLLIGSYQFDHSGYGEFHIEHTYDDVEYMRQDEGLDYEILPGTVQIITTFLKMACET